MLKKLNQILKFLIPRFLLFYAFPARAIIGINDVGSGSAGVFTLLLNGVAGVLSLLLIPVLGLITAISAKVFDWLVLMSAAFTASVAVESAWMFLRDLANISFIFILLTIAISMILRLGRFNDPKLIFRLIVIALLINFSRVIALVIIDFSHLLSMFFLDQAVAGGGKFGLSNNIMAQLNIANIFKLSQASSSGFGSTTAAVSAVTVSQVMNIIVMAAVAIFFAIAAFLMLSRLVMLTFLVIASPIAFISYLIPKWQNYFSDWWEKLIKYSIFAPALTFFLYLALTFPQAAVKATTDNSANLEFGGLGISSAFFSSGEVLLIYLITLGFLYAGVYMSQFLGIRGSQKTMAWVNRKADWLKKKSYQLPAGYAKKKFVQGVAGQKMFGKIPGAGYLTGKALSGAGKAGAKAGDIFDQSPWFLKPSALPFAAAGVAGRRAGQIPLQAKEKVISENKKILDKYKSRGDDDIINNKHLYTKKELTVLSAERLATRGKATEFNEKELIDHIERGLELKVNVLNILKNDPALINKLSEELKAKLAKSMGKEVTELTTRSILASMKSNEMSLMSKKVIEKLKEDIKDAIRANEINNNHLSKLFNSENKAAINATAAILEELESEIDTLPKKTAQFIRGQAQTVISQSNE